MKKNLLIGAASIMFMLTACNGNDNVLNQTLTCTPVTLITSTSDGITSVTSGYYTFNVEIYSQMGNIDAKEIVLNGASMGFKTEDFNYATTGYDIIFKNITGTSTGSMSYPMHDGNFVVTPYYNYPGMDPFRIESPYNPNITYGFPTILVGSYRLGDDYKVKTFQKNTFFYGTTNTTYSFMGSDGRYTTEDILYGLILDLPGNTATIIMYNAKFTDLPQEPKKAQINIEGLTVDYSNGNIVVKGENVIPNVIEGSSSTPYPNFTFDNIELKTTSEDLTQATITYKVAGIYNGYFEGKYADLSYIK